MIISSAFISRLLVSAFALFMTAGIAFAAPSVESAKMQGIVGERPDGLLGAVTNSPEAQELVNAINAERLQKYNGIAAKNGTDVSKVQALAGKKLIENAQPGEYIMNAGGGWQKK